MADFEWPWQYKFPPFFTIQPNLETRKKQLEAWCSLILSYHRHTKSYSLNITEAQSSPLFYNKSLSRKLHVDGIYTILDELNKRGHIEWKDKSKKECLIMWRTPGEWGKTIYKWADDKGMKNTVCTMYEITNGEDSENTEFHGLENWLLLRSLKCLQTEGKCEIMAGNEGVKFF
ncbi:vacuolar protein-sorting-associated protein 25 [Patella vulgata]|uniref:vacuolar protein-sorting-associated protein 25 n=1 Tax=Patella vulgata TaxID=6465 RepID=UPI00217F8C57|nr:vacuolar protein-sorting-associated protein 25 [Patella vulgata]